MGRASPAIAAFCAGEFAPQMEGRSDVEKYAIATHIQQNFIPLKQGPSTFRQGTAFVQNVNSTARAWLQRFEFSQTQAFVIEFGGGYCRFYTNHGPLLSTGSGNYDGSRSYVIGNQAVLLGVTYYCIAPTTGNAPPNAAFWYPMAPYNGSPTIAIYEIPSPFAAADLTDSLGEFALQIQQSGDVLYIAGGSAGAGYPPYTLTRYANAPPNWSFAEYSPVDGPFANPLPLTPNANIALTASAVSGSITISAYGGSLFAATDVGRLVRLQSQTFSVTPWQFNVPWSAGQACSNNGNNYVALNSASSGASAPVQTQGSVLDGPTGVMWLYTDSNYGIAQITAFTNAGLVTANVLKQLPAAVVGGTSSITGISQASPPVVLAANSWTLQFPVFIVGALGMTEFNGNMYSLAAVSSTSFSIAGVNSSAYPAYTTGGLAIANATLEWQLGAWSNTTEWPRANAFFKDRLFWAGKLNLWGSVPGLYTSHAPDEFGQQTTDSAMNEVVSGADASNICWLSPAIILLIGTEGGEFGLDAANYSTAPLGPANVEILRQSSWRCRHIAPLLIGTSVLYVQRAGRKVFAMDYNFYLNRYDSTDQSKFAYHITIGGLTTLAYMQEPWSLLLGARADGTWLTYTFNREDQVTAWARHNMGNGGVVESIAVIPAPDASRDEAWFIVNRNGVRTVEYLTKHYEGPQAGYVGDAQASAWYVDCGVQSNAPPAPGATSTAITGLPSVMWNQTVAILADGSVQPQQIVSPSGSITLTGAFTIVTIGFPYQGNIVPMRPEGGADVGTAQGKKKDGAQLVVRVVDSAGGSIGMLSNQNAVTQVYQDPLGLATQSPQYLEAIDYNDTATPLDSPPPIRSGDFPVSLPTAQNSDQDMSDFYILVQQNAPLPFTLIGLFPSYEVQEPR